MAEEETPIPDDIKPALIKLADEFERADWSNRDRIIRQCRKRENYWNGNQFLFWSEVAHDWRNPQDFLEEFPNYTLDPSDYAKNVNIYAAHGESIIAALSTGVPYTEFAPDDAESTTDINTAKAFNSIAEIIQKHNDINWLNTRALHILYNQNYLAAYTYYHEDKKYGTIQKPIKSQKEVINRVMTCPNCGNEISRVQLDPQNAVGLQPIECPQCGPVEPFPEDTLETVSFIEDYEEIPKGRQKIELYGPIHVAIPFYSDDQSRIPYLILKHEQHYALMQSIYPNIADKIGPGGQVAIDRWARLPENFMDRTRAELISVRQCWFRPWAFNLLGYDHEDTAKLKALFPTGCYCVIVGDQIAEAHDENLDDHWTIAKQPTSNYLHAEAIGQRLIPIQDMENDLDNLTFDTIRFGVPVTFFNSAILDGKKFEQTRAEPGMMYPVKPDLSGDIQKNFFQTHTAALSKEVDTFGRKLTEMAQFTLGDYPSIYGGTIQGGSGTAAEYSMSRNQALQRLQLIWRTLTSFWPKVVEKAVRSYAENLKEDESFSNKQGNSFINVWIRKSEMQGSVGLVEAESSESFPISWAQKRDILIQLMQYNSPDINAAMFHPENASLIARIIGFPELYIPGDEDRTKQLSEIAQLLTAAPIMPEPQMDVNALNGPENAFPEEDQTAQPMQMGPPQPTIMPEQDVDNHEIHVQIIRAWCNGEVGQSVKAENPKGYANVLAHLQMHLMMVPPPMPEEQPGKEKEKPSGVE